MNLVNERITTFDIGWLTCLAPDWSKQDMVFLLFQKYCDCPRSKAPTCCTDGWHLVFTGSRFCTTAESRYAPVKGLGPLNDPRLGPLTNVTVPHVCPPGLSGSGHRVTDHERLESISERKGTALSGKWHRGSDSMSCSPAAAVQTSIRSCLPMWYIINFINVPASSVDWHLELTGVMISKVIGNLIQACLHNYLGLRSESCWKGHEIEVREFASCIISVPNISHVQNYFFFSTH